MTEWWQSSAVELVRALRSFEISPTELTDAILDRCKTCGPRINAITHLDESGARAAARKSEQRLREGSLLSLLDGIPITIKDNLLVKDMPATWGSQLFAEYLPSQDEIPMARLRASGAVFLGKTNVPEFTLQGYTDNRLFGPTRNPWNLQLTPGGSSGGAVAAVASGFAPLAIGTDGGGSTRRPAGFTGLVGLKSSPGRIARGNGFPAILYDLEAIGLIARTVSDVALLYDVLAGPDPRDRGSLLFDGLANPATFSEKNYRVLYVPRFGNAPVDPEITVSVKEAAQRLAELGHFVEEGEAPFDHDVLNQHLMTLFSTGLACLIGDRDYGDKLDVSLVPVFAAGRKVTGAEYLRVLGEIWRIRSDLAAFFDRYDFILTPSSAAQPWPASEPFPKTIAQQPVSSRGHAIFTGFANLAGLPGICLPGSPSKDNIPIGFQLVGAFGSDRELIAMADRYETAYPWAHRWPPIA